ncbi:purine-nucleoside phosphorylase [Desulfomicrobium escambiense]|uniref:purine-nucleoside phosphorylase n=1 Tax=Desulfomicrobium escambiense TaxID=29503 RepID=UPI00041A9FAA|nr:purine-nucleoside phosphorylase [Desulfomicrobium escambiense]
MQQRMEDVKKAADSIATACPEAPKTALILGSGLGDWVEEGSIRLRIPYADIPGFPVSTVKGHAGALLLADVQGTPVFVLSGRFHLYEGYDAGTVTMPVRVLGLLGVTTLIATNAAGALHPLFATGGLMVLTDHINMTGHNPLTGPNIEAWGPRFPDMSQVYCPALREKAMQAALRCGQRLEQGVYVAVAGPSLETPAETRMLRILGADAVGMSTVPEAIVARHMGMRVLGISCLTNKNLPDCMAPTSHEEILDQAGRSAAALGALLRALIPNLGG